MFGSAKLVVAALTLGVGLAVGGCQSSSSNSAHASKGGVVCDRCKVADVRTPYTVPSYEGPRTVGFLTTKSLECANCREGAEAYATTGKLDPVCKTCGGNRKIAIAN
jgi:hypothetical protein